MLDSEPPGAQSAPDPTSPPAYEPSAREPRAGVPEEAPRAADPLDAYSAAVVGAVAAADSLAGADA